MPKISELPAATSVSPADEFILNQAGITKRVPASSIVSPFFRLDASSIAQLQNGGNPDFKAGGGGTTQRITTQAFAERGDTLLYTPNGGTAITELFLFTPVIAWPGTRRDMDIHMEVVQSVAAPGYVGPVFLSDDTGANAFAHLCNGAGEWSTLINNSAVERSGVNGPGGGRYCIYRIRGDKPAGGPPRISSLASPHVNAGGTLQIRRSGSSSTARGGANEFGSASTMGSSWNAPSLGRFGFMVSSSGGNPPPAAFNILSYQVFLV